MVGPVRLLFVGCLCGWFYDVLQDADSMVGPVRLLFGGRLCGWFYNAPRDACLMIGPVRLLGGIVGLVSSLFVGRLCGWMVVLRCSAEHEFQWRKHESQVQNMVISRCTVGVCAAIYIWWLLLLAAR